MNITNALQQSYGAYNTPAVSKVKPAVTIDDIISELRNMGVTVTVRAVPNNPDAIGRNAKSVAGFGSVTIAPNILEDMAGDASVRQKYFNKIKEWMDFKSDESNWTTADGRRVTSMSMVIHECGAVHFVMMGEGCPPIEREKSVEVFRYTTLGVTTIVYSCGKIRTELPQKDAQGPDSDTANCLSYRLFLGRGTPERIFSDTNMRLAKIHGKLGLDWQPPDFINGHTEFEPYMELDTLFGTFTFQPPLIQVITNDYVNGRLVLNCTFAQMDATAYRLAAILADTRSRLDTEGLAEKLETANLPQNIDREQLLKTLLHTASEGLNKAEEFVESEIQSNAERFAIQKFRILVDYDARDTDSEEFRAKFEPFHNAVEQLMRQNIESAGTVINEMGLGKFAEFFGVNTMPARGFTALQVENFLKGLPPLDNTVDFELFENNFTRGQLEQRIGQIKSLLGRAMPFTLRGL